MLPFVFKILKYTCVRACMCMHMQKIEKDEGGEYPFANNSYHLAWDRS